MSVEHVQEVLVKLDCLVVEKARLKRRIKAIGVEEDVLEITLSKLKGKQVLK